MMKKEVENVVEPLSREPTSDTDIHGGTEPFEVVDVEKNAAGPELSRVPSGPVYTIFSYRAKMFILVSVSIASLISPFGATTFYPALNVLAKDLHVTPSLINISLTTYMIAQAIAPSILAGMSDSGGRRLSFLVCYIIYICANIGLALQTNYAALLVLRMVQAAGCSATIALSSAVVADIATSAERGKFMGYATAGLLIGPSFGPTIGGLLAQYLGWRSIFWFLAIFTGVLFVVFGAFFPETCRNVVGNGSIPAKGVNLSILGYLQQRRHARETDSIADDLASLHESRQGSKRRKCPNPFETLRILADKESCIILFYNGFFFTGMMIISASLPHLYKDAYNLNVLDTGLCYIALGMGSLASTFSMGRLCDWNFARHAKRVGLEIRKGRQQDLTNFPIELVRFQVVLIGHVIGTAAIIVYGWTVKFRTHLAGPEIALFFVGFDTSTAFNITNALLIDLHKDKPATATAAVNLVRCLLSAGGAAAIIPMCNAMNPGWAFTFIALIFVLWTGMIFLIMNKGMQWRIEAAEKRARKESIAAGEEAREEVEASDLPHDDNRPHSEMETESDSASARGKEESVHANDENTA